MCCRFKDPGVLYYSKLHSVSTIGITTSLVASIAIDPDHTFMKFVEEFSVID